MIMMKLMFAAPVARDAVQATAQSSTWGTRSPSETRFWPVEHVIALIRHNLDPLNQVMPCDTGVVLQTRNCRTARPNRYALECRNA